MFSSDFTPVSKQYLQVLLKIASDYAYIIGSINNPKEPKDPSALLRINMLSYMVFIYGKLVTSIRILNGYKVDDIIPSLTGTSYDQFTCFDITRSVYEAYLQSSWILKEFETEEQRHFISLWWTVRAFSERAVMAKSRGTIHENLAKEDEKIRAYTIVMQTRYSDYLQLYTAKFGKLNKKAVLPNWPKPSQLYLIAGVSKFHHNYIYKYHSLYSHAEPFAMMQMEHTIKNPIDVNEHIAFVAPYLVNFSVMAMDNFSNLYPEAELCIKENKNLQELIKSASNYLKAEGRIK